MNRHTYTDRIVYTRDVRKCAPLSEWTALVCVHKRVFPAKWDEDFNCVMLPDGASVFQGQQPSAPALWRCHSAARYQCGSLRPLSCQNATNSSAECATSSNTIKSLSRHSICSSRNGASLRSP